MSSVCGPEECALLPHPKNCALLPDSDASVVDYSDTSIPMCGAGAQCYAGSFWTHPAHGPSNDSVITLPACACTGDGVTDSVLSPYYTGCSNPASATLISYKSTHLNEYLTKGSAQATVSQFITVDISATSYRLSDIEYLWNVSNPERFGVTSSTVNGSATCEQTGTCNECFWLTLDQTSGELTLDATSITIPISLSTFMVPDDEQAYIGFVLSVM